MKLLSCYIENYGAITKKDFNFNESITEFNLENGSGKTTLASFIKAMFYGLEGYTSASKGFCERKHYYPFNGGEFGGNLTFEKGGNVYKIERFFGDKSTVSDTLTVYKNGEVTSEFGDEVGVKVFGVDKQSFERTIFISSDEIEISSTDSINSKLGGVLLSDDDVTLAAAFESLDKAAKKYKKARGGNDFITKESDAILDYKNKIANATIVAEKLEQKYEKKIVIVKQIKELNAKITAQQTLNEELSLWENYESRLAEINSKEKELNSINVNDLPTENEIETLSSLIDEYYKLNYEIERLNNNSLQEEDKRLLAVFDGKEPSDENIAGAESAVLEIRNIANELKYVPQTIAVTKPVEIKQNTSGGLKAAMAISGVVAALGIGLMFINLIAGVAALAVGLIGLVASGFLYLNKKTGLPSGEILQVENVERRKLEDKQTAFIDVIKNLLMPYGYYTNKGVEFDFYKFKDDIAKYKQIKKHFNNVKVEVENNTKLKLEIENQLELKFKKLGVVDGEFKFRLITLTNKISKIQTLKNSLENDKKVLEKYKAEKSLISKPSGEFIDLKLLNSELETLRYELSVISKQIEFDEDDASKLSDYIAEKELAEERLLSFKHKHKLLTATYSLIERADNAIKEKYISPVKTELISQADILEKTLGEKISMTKNLEVSYERAGKFRSEKHLSSGQKCLLALCFRLALVKNLFENETPFFVLDDPFISLDEKHIKRAMELLEELGKKYQIIYFTCHDSRSIEKRL